ncbi:hypothetical protein [Mycolicibacterium sp. XJ879]
MAGPARLVTVGSPLAHAEILLAAGRQELRRRTRRRLLPTNPPIWQPWVEKDYNIRYKPYRGGPADRLADGSSARWLEERIGTERLHPAAPFAATTWTNLYFKHDLVAGALAPHFGDGIRDVCLGEFDAKLTNFVGRRYPHSSYWPGRGKNRIGTDESARELRNLILNVAPMLVIEGDAKTLRAVKPLLEPKRRDWPHNDPNFGDLVEVRLLQDAIESTQESPVKRWL